MTLFVSCCLCWVRWCDLGLTPGKVGVKASSLREGGQETGFSSSSHAERMRWRNTARSLKGERGTFISVFPAVEEDVCHSVVAVWAPAPFSPDFSSPLPKTHLQSPLSSYTKKAVNLYPCLVWHVLCL